jgi:hypothetical protein
MRTTLAIDDDVLIAARALAEQQRRSLGEVVSDLARRSLRRPVAVKTRNGLPQLPLSKPGAVVTMDIVNALRDEEA